MPIMRRTSVSGQNNDMEYQLTVQDLFDPSQVHELITLNSGGAERQEFIKEASDCSLN
jgi:hypothetical protein